jgi:hypothetical protein
MRDNVIVDILTATLDMAEMPVEIWHPQKARI